MSEPLAPYKPASNAAKLDTFTPQAMAYEMQESLRQLKFEVGNVDEYVMRKLQYSSLDDLYACFGAEQIDAGALAIRNIENNGGIIIGDQTGIGKGRIAGLVIRFAVLNGYNTIFITEKATLFSDLYRDLYDIKSDNFVPLIYNADKDNARITYETYENGTPKTVQLYKKPLCDVKSTQQLQSLIEGKSTLPEGYDFLMTTYSQLNQDDRTNRIISQVESWAKYDPNKKVPPQYKTNFLREYAKGSVIVMDEAHNASGAESSTGYYLREQLGASKGAGFLSATYAKRPDNMGTYAIKTSIDQARLYDLIDVVINNRTEQVKSYKRLETVFAKGGVALQEVIAADLAREGEMVRRQRSFEGIEVTWKYLETQKEEHSRIYDGFTKIMRAIIDFQENYITKEFLESFKSALAQQGGSAQLTQGTEQGQLQNTPYFNKVYHSISQLLFSIKALEVAQEAIEELRQNRKVVIAFRSTMESFMSEFDYQDGDIVENHSFSLVMKKALDGVMKVTANDAEGKKENIQILPTDLSSEGQAEYYAILKDINESNQDISMSPIDVLINTIESYQRPNARLGGKPSEFFRVRECTGRSGQIRVKDGKATYNRYKADKKEYFRQFNAGEADVLLINASSSTGVSCHASEKFADQRQRTMLIHEPELDINTEVQKRGRVNRTGQVVPPAYKYVSSGIAAERRLFMVLKKKLKSLDANTTGNQQNTKSQLEVDDFFNKYGEIVIKAFLAKGNPLALEIGSYMSGFKVEENKEGESEVSGIGGDLVRKVTNIVSILTCKQQDEFYDTIIQQYNEYVEELKRKDEYDLETEFLPYEAQLQDRSLFKEGDPLSTSVFSNDAYRDNYTVNNLRKPYKKSLIEGRIDAQLKGNTPNAHNKAILDGWLADYKDYATSAKENIKYRLEDANTDLNRAKATLKKWEAKDPAKEKDLAKKITKAKGIVEKAEKNVKAIQDRIEALPISLETDKDNVISVLNYFTLGRPVVVPEVVGDTTKLMKAVVYQVERTGDSASPSSIVIRFALANSYKEGGTSLYHIAPFFKIKEATAKAIQLNGEKYVSDIFENWNKHTQDASGDRVGKVILTGNLLAAIDEAVKQVEDAARAEGKTGKSPKVKIVKFTTFEGEVRSGIELSDENVQRLGTAVSVESLAPKIAKLDNRGEVALTKGNDSIAIEKRNGNVCLIVGNSNQYKKYWANPDIIALIEPTPQEEIEGSAGSFKLEPPRQMVANIALENLNSLLKILANFGFSAKTNWQKVDMTQTAGRNQNTASSKIAVYELPTPYEKGKYPSQDFEGTQSNPQFEFGVIKYANPLSAKQRLQYNLVPVFDSLDEPYAAWKQAVLSNKGIKAEWDKTLTEAQKQGYDKALSTLGIFIATNAHESGNMEFVFGRTSYKALGLLAYSDFIGKSATPSALSVLAKQLAIELEMG